MLPGEAFTIQCPALGLERALPRSALELRPLSPRSVTNEIAFCGVGYVDALSDGRIRPPHPTIRPVDVDMRSAKGNDQ